MKKCGNIPPLVVDEVSNKLTNLSPTKLYNFLLERLSLQKEMEFTSPSSEFIISGYRFCLGRMQSYFGTSDYLLKTVAKEHLDGITTFKHGNKGKLYRRHRRDTAVAFIHLFAEIHSENMPDRSCLRLPSYLNIKTLYGIYFESIKVPQDKLGEREFYYVINYYIDF